MISDQKKKVLELFAEGRRYYKLMNFQDALQAFSEAIKIDKTDGPSLIYYQRCKHYLDNPPPPDWDGVFVMKTK